MQPRGRLGAVRWIVALVLVGSGLIVVGSGRAGSTLATRDAAAPETRYHPRDTGSDCLSCHPGAAPPASTSADAGRQGIQAFGLPPEAALAHWWFGCSECHTLHGGTTNLHLISETIETDYLPPEYAVKSGPRQVVFLNHEGPNSYADGDGIYDGVCEVCHTQTRYHRGDGSGDRSHFPGVRCTNCHDHSNYFQPTGVANHPQAVTECGTCHAGPGGEPDLLGAHAYRCQSCHPAGFGATILGPLGTWQQQCTECHNPTVAATGNLQTPTKGHRCIVCHGRQLPTGNRREIHEEHVDKANCVVCHGRIPDVGTAVGSGNRAICAVCHEAGTYAGVPQREFHEKHVPKGASCLECHGGMRPPVDVRDGPAVGTSTNVCQICHTRRTPSEFWPDMAGLHATHAGESIDCGSCHQAATLQDDRAPMPAHDDSVRARIDRALYGECRFCHGRTPSSSARSVHGRHVARQGQWCYTCHDGSDARPLGLQPPVTRPAESCRLCHTSRQYAGPTPFAVHKEHADREVKCYACHQLTPPLSGWPAAWLAPSPVRTWQGGWTRPVTP